MSLTVYELYKIRTKVIILSQNQLDVPDLPVAKLDHTNLMLCFMNYLPLQGDLAGWEKLHHVTMIT